MKTISAGVNVVYSYPRMEHVAHTCMLMDMYVAVGVTLCLNKFYVSRIINARVAKPVWLTGRVDGEAKRRLLEYKKKIKNDIECVNN